MSHDLTPDQQAHLARLRAQHEPPLTVERHGDSYTVSTVELLRYDPERGTLDTFVDGAVREQMLIRQGLVEQVTREVVIAELRRLGYSVTDPA